MIIYGAELRHAEISITEPGVEQAKPSSSFAVRVAEDEHEASDLIGGQATVLDPLQPGRTIWQWIALMPSLRARM